METSYHMPKEKMTGFTRNMAMNTQEGLYLYGVADPGIQRLLPPPLELSDPNFPLFYLYAVNIREPTFAPWYLEGGVGVLAKYGEKTGIYFFSLQLSGPGAEATAMVSREKFGLPKKLCERILVERNDAYGHCYIERGGVRLADVELEMGRYNVPAFHAEGEKCQGAAGGIVSEGGCLLHRYRLDDNAVKDMELVYYNSPTRCYTWEPASATVRLSSSVNDPWGEIPLISVLGAAWCKCDNAIRGTSVIYRYPQDAAEDAMQYLFAGRYDRSLLCGGHQRYETT
ncbi:MAG: acetoacetate decarboxylase family protein [Clostridia bacterium]|nr:acetoacetate decarboxylase family protein [Clostridia bacterium]